MNNNINLVDMNNFKPGKDKHPASPYTPSAYRVALVDYATNRHIGIIEGKVKLLGEYDYDSKPFILKSKIQFLPREGEYLKIADMPKPVQVVNIVHDLVISTTVPSYVLLFIEYTKGNNN